MAVEPPRSPDSGHQSPHAAHEHGPHAHAPEAHDHEHGSADGHGHEHGGPLGWLRSTLHGFAGHSHGTPETDAALEGSAEGIRAVKLSLAGLLLTALLQAVVVVASGSVALMADTIHNLADALTSVPLWIAFILGRRPPNRRYTYGYGRAEDIAGLAIVVVINLSAAIAAWESICKLLEPQPIQRTRTASTCCTPGTRAAISS